MKTIFDMDQNTDIAWCPGCGNYSILKIMKESLQELGLTPNEVVFVSGIGQAAKLPHYIRGNVFNGLHGRAIPAAIAIKASNPKLTVIAESGDGDMYGEGGNHFLHGIRRNPNITNIIHNNMVYGLTKGQGSPTSRKGFVTTLHQDGVKNIPFNPIATSIVLGATFVARIYAGDITESKEIVKKAIKHRGYALVDILQPCVVFNKVNNHKWYKENTYYLDNSKNQNDINSSLKIALETERLPLGIIYKTESLPTFEDNTGLYSNDSRALYERELNMKDLMDYVKTQKY